MASFSGTPTYAVTDELTEWDEIMIKKGIKTRDQCLIEKGLNPDDFRKTKEIVFEAPTEEELLEQATLDDLDELAEDTYDDSRMLEEFRAKRIAEMKQKAVQNRFGDYCEISKDEYLREVTEASKSSWVVIHLYQDSILGCNLVDEAILQLAPKFKFVKFLKIRSTMAVENWPTSRLPALFLYRDGELKHQVIGIDELGGKTLKADNLEWYLSCKEIVTTELEEDPVRTYVTSKLKHLSAMKARGTGLGSDDELADSD
jgi:hypothetical protein